MANELQVVPETKLANLSADERLAYERHIKSGKGNLAADYSARLFQLFLLGVSVPDIVKLNPGLTLGQVAAARVNDSWDDRRSQHVAELLTETSSLLRTSASESLRFISLVLAVAHREHGECLKRYLATGDPKELGNFRIENIKQYQTVLDTLARLVGADQKKSVNHTHQIVGPEASPSAPDQGVGVLGALPVGRLTPQQADAIRKAMEETTDEK